MTRPIADRTLAALANVPSGEKLHLGKLSETVGAPQPDVIRTMERLIKSGKVDASTLRPVAVHECAPINPLADQVKAVIAETGESWAAFARRAKITYKSFPQFAARNPSKKISERVRRVLAGEGLAEAEALPPRRPRMAMVEKMGADELERRKARDAELLETRRGVCASRGSKSKAQGIKGTARTTIGGEAFRALGREVEEEKLANIQDMLREIGRRWPADWAAVKAMARSDDVMPGIMLHRVLQAGLDCMREAG